MSPPPIRTADPTHRFSTRTRTHRSAARRRQQRCHPLVVVLAAAVCACCIVVATLLFSDTAAAAGSHLIVLAKKDKQPTTLAGVVTNLRVWLMGILTAVATLFLTVGALRYLAAGGDPGQVEKAKSALKSAAIGYGLALLAPILITLVGQLVT